MELLIFAVLLLVISLVIVVYRKNLPYTIVTGIVLLIIYYLTTQVNLDFLYVWIVLIVVLLLLTAILYFIKQKSNTLLLIMTGLTMFCGCMIVFAEAPDSCTHEIVIEVPVTVVDGKISTYISDDMINHFEKGACINFLEFSKLPNGEHMQKFIVTYSCMHSDETEQVCVCTEKSICEFCKDIAYLNN